MPTTVLQAAVGAGKTEATLQRLTKTLYQSSDALERGQIPRIWVLLATKRQEYAFRQRLIDFPDDHHVYFNIEFFEFYELYSRLLNIAGQPARRMTEAARIGLLRTIIDDLELQVFGNIAQTAGFARLVADFIYELKQNLVKPETFSQAANSAKDHELARIYAHYQDELITHDLVDREGEGWLALDCVRTENNIQQFLRTVDLILVDGFDQFTPVQAQLLAALAHHSPNLALTLTTVPERETTIGRRFARALHELERAHADFATPFKKQPVDNKHAGRAPDLNMLNNNIFRQDAMPQAPQATQPTAIQLIEAPDPAHETAAVMRRVKALLLQNVAPDNILIALRDAARYQPYFDIYAHRYGIPTVRHYNTPLMNNPAVDALLQVLALGDGALRQTGAFMRQDVLDALQSPYINPPDLDADAINKLERLSREYQVIGGKPAWLQAIEEATQPRAADDNDSGEDMPPLLTTAEASDLSIALETFFDIITPVMRQTLEERITWLECLIGSDDLEDDERDFDEDVALPCEHRTLNMLKGIRAVEGDPRFEDIINRDTEAIRHIKRLLHGFLMTQLLLRDTRGHITDPDWPRFYSDLLAALGNTPPDVRDPARSGRVLITTANDARGLPHDHIFIPGLSESIFPAPIPEDPLYLDSERLALNQRGVTLQPMSERADDEGVFYELISQARQTLTLSRPTVREGKPWNASHLWRMVRRVFDDLDSETLPSGHVIAADEAASLDEALLGAVADSATDKTTAAIRRWLAQTYPQAWAHVQHGSTTERDRLTNAPHNAYTGKLSQAHNIARAADALNDERRWSATQLNDYGLCGYRFFAKRLLKLEALETPDDGLDILQMGLINHAILQETYEDIRVHKFAITPDNHDDALAIFDDAARRILQDAPDTYHFQPTAMWHNEKTVILRRLRQLVSNDFSSDAALTKAFKHLQGPRYPHALELGFGVPDATYGPLRIPLYQGDTAASDDVQAIYVRGSIDRVDRIGDQLIVIDYKTGSTPIKIDELQEGRNFQMMVYVLALNDILRRQKSSLRVGGGAFWHIRNQKTSSDFAVTSGDAAYTFDDGLIADAQAHVVRYIQQGRAGQFLVQPNQLENGRCSRYCEYYQLCRVANTYRHKAQ